MAHKKRKQKKIRRSKLSIHKFIFPEKTGRSDRIRTYDPLVPNKVRYQAALHSDTSGGVIAR
jgi:hypothetical protein